MVARFPESGRSAVYDALTTTLTVANVPTDLANSQPEEVGHAVASICSVTNQLRSLEDQGLGLALLAGGFARQATYLDDVHARTRQLKVGRIGVLRAIAGKLERPGRQIDDDQMGCGFPMIVGILQRLGHAAGEVGDVAVIAVVDLQLADQGVITFQTREHIGST